MLKSKSSGTFIVLSYITRLRTDQIHFSSAYKVVLPEWVMDSVEAKMLLPWQNYRLNSPVEVHQKELSFQTQTLSSNSNSTVDNHESSHLPSANPIPKEESKNANEMPPPNLPKLPKGKEVAQVTGSELNLSLLSNDWARKNSSVNPEFLDKYYTTSRLHYLSMWKAELKSIVNKLRIRHSSQSQRKKMPRTENSKIMYVGDVLI
jgi:DNA repair protein REV1